MTDSPDLRTRILAAISSVPCERCRQRPDYKPSDCETHTCRQMYEQEADAVMDVLLQTPHTGDKSMTDHTDRSTEALLARRAITEKATPGHMETVADAAHIAANDPQTIMADIDEILRLRAEVERLEKEADWLANRLNDTFVGQCSFCGEIKTCTTRDECAKTWRDLAREAVERETCPKN